MKSFFSRKNDSQSRPPKPSSTRESYKFWIPQSRNEPEDDRLKFSVDQNDSAYTTEPRKSNDRQTLRSSRRPSIAVDENYRPPPPQAASASSAAQVHRGMGLHHAYTSAGSIAAANTFPLASQRPFYPGTESAMASGSNQTLPTHRPEQARSVSRASTYNITTTVDQQRGYSTDYAQPEKPSTRDRLREASYLLRPRNHTTDDSQHRARRGEDEGRKEMDKERNWLIFGGRERDRARSSNDQDERGILRDKKDVLKDGDGSRRDRQRRDLEKPDVPPKERRLGQLDHEQHRRRLAREKEEESDRHKAILQEQERRRKEDERRQKELDHEQDRQSREREEQERRRREELERKERAVEQERKLKEEQERRRRDDLERKQKELDQQERQRREWEEQERRRREELEQRQKEVEQERRLKEEQERLRKEWEEQERRRKEDIERKQKEEQERLRREKEEQDRQREHEQLMRKQREEAELKEREEHERRRKEREEYERRQKEEQRRREWEEYTRKQMEEQARKQREQEEQERRRKEWEEYERKQREIEEQRRREIEEQRRQEEEQKRQQQEELRRREEELKRREQEALKRKEQEELRRREEELKRREQEELRRKEEELKRREQEALKRKEQEELRRREEELKRREQEELRRKEEELKRREQEALKRKEQEELRRREEELKRRQQEELRRKEQEELKRREQEELKRKEQEELRRREEELKRRQQEELRRKEQEELRRREQEELKRREQEEQRRKEQEELQRKEQEELRWREEDLKRREQEELKRKEQEELRRREEEEQRRKEQEEQRRKEQEEQRRKEQEERRRREEDQKRRELEEQRRREQEELRRKEQEERERKRLEHEAYERRRIELEEQEKKRRELEEQEKRHREQENEKRRREQEEQEKRKKEQEEQEKNRREQEEQERRRREQEEQEMRRREQEELERRRKEHEEQERMRKENEEKERRRQEQEDQEKIRKQQQEQEEEDKRWRQWEEYERKVKEEQEKRHREREESERIRKETELAQERERRRKEIEEQDRRRQLAEFERQQKETEDMLHKRKEDERQAKRQREEHERRQMEEAKQEKAQRAREDHHRKQLDVEPTERETDRERKEAEALKRMSHGQRTEQELKQREMQQEWERRRREAQLQHEREELQKELELQQREILKIRHAEKERKDAEEAERRRQELLSEHRRQWELERAKLREQEEMARENAKHIEADRDKERQHQQEMAREQDLLRRSEQERLKKLELERQRQQEVELQRQQRETQKLQEEQERHRFLQAQQEEQRIKRDQEQERLEKARQKQAEEEERRRLAEEQERRRLSDEEERRRLAEEHERRRLAEEQERLRAEQMKKEQERRFALERENQQHQQRELEKRNKRRLDWEPEPEQSKKVETERPRQEREPDHWRRKRREKQEQLERIRREKEKEMREVLERKQRDLEKLAKAKEDHDPRAREQHTIVHGETTVLIQDGVKGRPTGAEQASRLEGMKDSKNMQADSPLGYALNRAVTPSQRDLSQAAVSAESLEHHAANPAGTANASILHPVASNPALMVPLSGSSISIPNQRTQGNPTIVGTGRLGNDSRRNENALRSQEHLLGSIAIGQSPGSVGNVATNEFPVLHIDRSPAHPRISDLRQQTEHSVPLQDRADTAQTLQSNINFAHVPVGLPSAQPTTKSSPGAAKGGELIPVQLPKKSRESHDLNSRVNVKNPLDAHTYVVDLRPDNSSRESLDNPRKKRFSAFINPLPHSIQSAPVKVSVRANPEHGPTVNTDSRDAEAFASRPRVVERQADPSLDISSYARSNPPAVIRHSSKQPELQPEVRTTTYEAQRQPDGYHQFSRNGKVEALTVNLGEQTIDQPRRYAHQSQTTAGLVQYPSASDFIASSRKTEAIGSAGESTSLNRVTEDTINPAVYRYSLGIGQRRTDSQQPGSNIAGVRDILPPSIAHSTAKLDMSEPAAERDLTPSRTAGTSVPVHALAPSVPVGHSLPLEAKGYYNADVGDSRTLAPSNVPRQDSKNITHSDPRVSATPISRESPLPQTALDRIDAKPSPVQKLHVPPSVQSVQQVVNHSQVITQKGIDNFGVSPGVVRSIERRDQRETGDPIPRRETKVDLLTEFPGNSNRNVRQTDKPSNGSRGLGNGIPHGTGIQLNDSPKGYLESNIASQFQGRRPSISLEDSNRIVDRDKQMVIPVQPQHTVHINHPLDQPVVSAPHHIGHRQASSVYVPPPSARPSLLQLPAVTAETPENPQLALANNENPTATVPGSVRPALVSLPPSTSKQDGNERVRRLETHTLNERLDITEQTYASRAPDQVRTTLQMSAGTAVPSSTRPILLELPEITSSDQERFRQKVEDTRSGRSHALKPDFRYPSVSSIVPGSARPPPLPLPSDSKEEERDRASRYADRPPASAPPTNQRHAISSKQSEHQQATTQHRTAVSRQEDNPQLGRHKHSWSVPPNIGPSTRQASSHHRPVHSQVPGSTRNATVPLPSQPQEPQRNLHPQVPGSTRHATIPLPTSHSYDHRPTYQQVPSITRQATMPPPVQMPRQSSYEPDETILLTPSSLAPTSMLPSLSQQANPRSSENVLPANNLASGSHSPPEQQNKSNPANAPSISRATHRRPRVIDDRDVQPAIKRSPKRRPHQVGEYGHRSVPIHQSQEDPRSESKPFNPFRYLGSHGPRKRTMSMVSLEARDGTAPSTVVGSPDASMCSTAPFTLPPVQDPIAAAEKWRNSEEAKFKESTKTRRSRPGVVVQVPVDEDRDSLDENKPSRPRRLGRRKRPPTRPTQERA